MCSPCGLVDGIIYFSCIFLYGTLSRRFGTIPTSHHQCHYYGTVIVIVAIAAMSPPVIIIVTIAAPSSVSLLRHCHHQCHYCFTVIISVTIAALSSSVISVTNTAPSPAEWLHWQGWRHIIHKHWFTFSPDSCTVLCWLLLLLLITFIYNAILRSQADSLPVLCPELRAFYLWSGDLCLGPT